MAFKFDWNLFLMTQLVSIWCRTNVIPIMALPAEPMMTQLTIVSRHPRSKRVNKPQRSWHRLYINHIFCWCNSYDLGRRGVLHGSSLPILMQIKSVSNRCTSHIDAETKWRQISLTTFSNAFSWKKIYKFRLRFYWSLFPRVQSTIFPHWFR